MAIAAALLGLSVGMALAGWANWSSWRTTRQPTVHRLIVAFLATSVLALIGAVLVAGITIARQ